MHDPLQALGDLPEPGDGVPPAGITERRVDRDPQEQAERARRGHWLSSRSVSPWRVEP
ncbi:hypothetical protein Aglo03_33860 [Actinokineospora globicatena]|uniref:Uncharacterized protein n=1 Tax=Actinokineospora globicatena TaxID=103729 RepID=A0A9W6V7B1_9PSEU|nr:hypothetical protein Aglo03_33860 [Actinokineospora globicatena]